MKIDMPLKIETKPNQTKSIEDIITPSYNLN